MLAAGRGSQGPPKAGNAGPRNHRRRGNGQVVVEKGEITMHSGINPLIGVGAAFMILVSGIWIVKGELFKHRNEDLVITRFDTDLGKEEIAAAISSKGYLSLTDRQKQACHKYYADDLQTLLVQVEERLLVSMNSIPHFDKTPQHGQMLATTLRLQNALANLKRHGTHIDPTIYQPLINQVIAALQR